MIHHTIAGSLLGLALTLPASATWLSGSELRRHCSAYLDDPESRDGAVCVAFMQGFLAGGRAAERDRRTAPSWSEAAADETFAQRAARTRVGSRLRGLQAATTRYCVGDGVTSSAVIRSVADHLEDRGERPGVSADRRVRDALARSFPCDDG
jgi:hypothetical protein